MDLNWRKFREPGWEEFFVRIAGDALRLIAETDPRRMRVVEREIAHVTNEVTTSGGAAEYVRGARRCVLDFDRGFRSGPVAADDPDYPWYVARVASIIVHEATHGRIESHCIPYFPSLRVRIERACHREQERFARRLTSDRFAFDDERFLAPFDPAAVMVKRPGRFQRSAAFLRRIRENYRGAEGTPDS